MLIVDFDTPGSPNARVVAGREADEVNKSELYKGPSGRKERGDAVERGGGYQNWSRIARRLMNTLFGWRIDVALICVEEKGQVRKTVKMTGVCKKKVSFLRGPKLSIERYANKSKNTKMETKIVFSKQHNPKTRSTGSR